MAISGNQSQVTTISREIAYEYDDIFNEFGNQDITVADESQVFKVYIRVGDQNKEIGELYPGSQIVFGFKEVVPATEF
mgnify:CR=1 FL=1